MPEPRVISIQSGVPKWRLEQFIRQTDLRKRPRAAQLVDAELQRMALEERKAA
jgi:hypothetical protein